MGAFALQDPPPSDPPAEDLGEKLIRKSVQAGDEDLMARIMRHMGEAARLLDVRFDAGEETQATQRRALELLDEAIAQVAANRRPQRGQGKASHPDKRTSPDQTDQQQSGQAERQAQAGAGSDGSEVTGRGDPTRVEPGQGRFEETRRAWGMLPERERDEVIQGIEERFLERYRKMIEDYYRALQGESESP